jgi:hypothetical protein
MKFLLSLILGAVCASAYSLTIDDVAGKWMVDVEASVAMQEAQIRKIAPHADDKTIADMLEAVRKESANGVVEFTGKAVSTYKEVDGAKTENEDTPVVGVATDQEALVLDCQKAHIVLRLRGDRLEMGMYTGDDVDQMLSIILKRADAAAAPPAPKP